jgi:hypothetical protein
MQNKVYSDDQGVIVIEVIGDQTVESVEQMGREVQSLITEKRGAGKPVLLLDDLSQMGKVGPDARKKVVQLASDFDYDRGAMTGKGGGVMRFGTNLMLRATGRGYRLRYYEKATDAREWLRAYTKS